MITKLEKNYQIFIVSKDEEAISAITRVFSDPLYTITLTKTGMEVLSLVSYKLPHIMLIGTDISDINAFELVSLIKKNSITRYVPCIVFGHNNEIQDRISAIDSGADGYLPLPFKIEELHSLVHAKLIQHDELYLLSVTDDLTGLFTRKEFFRRFSFEIESNIHSCVSIAIIDIDHFKNINDTYGHPVGDIVLIQLANMLKSLQTENYTPARFGGEEFVVIFPGVVATEAKKIIDRIRLQFSSINFKTNTPDKTFSVSFSAGISEYPSMGTNLSELLSRADQALYAAKTDGRNRVYTFSPIMSRNDKFWEYIKTNKIIKNIFIDPFLHEPITGYHYLPVVLENLLSSETSIDSIGVLIIKVVPLVDFYRYRGYKNFEYDIENIALLIPKICEIHFPYERYVTVADLYDYEIAILFPFPSSKTNISEFTKLCKELVLDISLQSIHHHVEIHYAQGVVPFHRHLARKILQEIKSIKASFLPLLSLANEAEIISSFSRAINEKKDITDYIFLLPVYNTSFERSLYHVLSKQLVSAKNFFDIMMKNAITSQKHYTYFIESLAHIVATHNVQIPLLINWVPAIDLALQIHTLQKLCNTLSLPKIVLAIDEIELHSFISQYEGLAVKNTTPIEFSVSNCYIGSNVLQSLSTIEFSMVTLSEHMIRNLHYFKDRIKIINGLRLFCDQINLPLYAPNILKDEEYRIIKDINIAYSSGPYIEQQYALIAAPSKTI